MLSTILLQRLQNLADHVNQDLALLKDYEDSLRFEDDPRRRARYYREIEQLKNSIIGYQHEYNDLDAHITNRSNEVLHNIAVQLQNMDEKLDILLTGQMTIWNDLANLRKDVFLCFNYSEQRIISIIVEQLDQKQLAVVRTLLDAVGENKLSRKEVCKALDDIKQIFIALHNTDISLPGQQKVEKAISSPSLDVKHKLKLTIPIIPLLVNYEGDLELDSRANLEKIWNWLVEKARRN